VYLNFGQAITVGTGNTITINPTADLLPGRTYSITYPAGLLKDATGNASPANSSTTAITLTTSGGIDTVAPTLVSSSPVDDSIGITSSRVVLNFNEPVIAGVGTIVIGNGTDIRNINVTDTTQITHYAGCCFVISHGVEFKRCGWQLLRTL
jgi:large repetitive protein